MRFSSWKRALLLGVGVLLLALPGVAQIGTTINIIPGSIVPYPTPVFIQISGVYKNGCVPQSPIFNIFGATITINTSNPSTICTQALTPWGPYTIAAGILPPGTYLVRVVHHPAGSGPELLGTRTFVVVAVQPPPPPTPTAVVCDPGAPVQGLYLLDGARYYATGGPDPNPDKRGADQWTDLRTIDPTFLVKWQLWGKPEAPFEAGLSHNGDWVIYRVATRGAPLTGIEFCLKAGSFSPAQAEIFVQTTPPDPTSAPPHDGDIRNQEGWVRVGTLTVLAGSYQFYRVSVANVAPSQFYNIAVRLIEEAPLDVNLLIAWLKLVA